MPNTLLLADDSATIQRVIEMTFAEEDVRVVTVGDGLAAIERIAADPPDIVLADTNMPEKDGYDVSAFVKADNALSHIPVVLLTGAFDPVDDERAREVGCDAVMVKPFEPKAVINRVRDLLGAAAESGTAAPGGSAGASADPGAAASSPPASAPELAIRDDASVGEAGGAGGGAAAPAVPAGGDAAPAAAASVEPGAADASPATPASAEPAASDFHEAAGVDPADAGVRTAGDAAAAPSPPVPPPADPSPPATAGGRAVPPGAAAGGGAAPVAAPDPAPAATGQAAPPAPARDAADPGPRMPAVPAVEAPAPPTLAEAFASLLAAEQGDLTRARAAYPWPRQAASVDEEDLIERVTERVVERLSNDVTGELVSEVVARVAERLVRDQIGGIEPA